MDKNLFEHINYIKNKNWEHSIFCPVIKKFGNEKICGVIHISNLTTIKKANLFILPTTKEKFDNLDGWTYNNVEEMVADGWEVD